MNATSRLEGLSTPGFSEVSGSDMNQIEGGDKTVSEITLVKEGIHVVRTIFDIIDNVLHM